MTSFFDDETTKTKFDFVKPKLKFDKQLNSPALLINNLSCLAPNSKTPKPGKYALHAGIIASYQADGANVANAVLEISFSALKFIAPSKKCPSPGFRLTKNGISFEFYSPELQIIEIWMKALRSVCVLSSFHDEYNITKTLGKGGFAKVYMAESKGDKMLYAVKSFQKKNTMLLGKDKAKPAMLNEINLMRSLNHENIVQLYEVHETEHSIYLVLELIKGRTLEETFKKQATIKKTFPERKTREMMQTILSTIKFISDQGIIHRDLKPANILIDSNEKIKIADFGLATPAKSLNPIFKKCGTPGYMAPEILDLNERTRFITYDNRCDVFSVGCMFFEMLFGYSMFKGYVSSELIAANKDFSLQFEALDIVKREQTNPQSKIDKEALNLLLKLLEPNFFKRITAEQALEHPYFGFKAVSAEVTSPTKSIYSGFLTPTKKPSHSVFGFSEDSIDSGTFIAPAANRFVEKESICIDLGRVDSEGKFDDLVSPSFSAQTHGIDDDKLGSEFSSNNLLTCEKPTPKLSFQGRSPRSPKNGDYFLKAVIFNKIHRQSEIGTEIETKATMVDSSRQNNSFTLTIPLAKALPTEIILRPIEECSDVGDLANEGLEIQKSMEHMKRVIGEMVPGRHSHHYSFRPGLLLTGKI